MTVLLLELADARELDVEVVGAPGAPLVLVQHGTPGGLGWPPSYDRAAGLLGLRLAGWARPGYGRSTRRPGRVVADVVGDALAVADALGAPRFAAVGGSGGGPHALALGALVPQRCVAVATIAGAAPYGDPDLDFLAGMGQDNRTEFGAALDGEPELRALLLREREGMAGETVEALLAAMRSVLSPPDVAVLTGEVAERTLRTMRRALAPGVDGWVDDDLAFVTPWGFAPQDVSVPAHVWQGGQDLMVPPAHGQHLADRLPDARPHLLPDEGHLTLHHTRIADVLAPLAEALAR